jgi:hypothetical protein
MLRYAVFAAILVVLLAGAAEAEPWSCYAAGYLFFVPDDRDVLSPTLTADRGRLHLEARYNYEAYETGSLFAGGNFAGGDELAWELTAMLGAAFGETGGVVPAYRGALYWSRFDLSTEGEYLIDTEVQADSFFYSWSEVAYSPRDWLRAGLAIQRTALYQTEDEVQFGVHAGGSHAGVDAALYVFDITHDAPTVVLLAGVAF